MKDTVSLFVLSQLYLQYDITAVDQLQIVIQGCIGTHQKPIIVMKLG